MSIFHDFKVSGELDRAFVACKDGYGAVLHFTGEDFAYFMDGLSVNLRDLGLDDAPDGLSIWEGKIKWFQVGNYLDGPDYDGSPKGTFRSLTSEEWKQLQATGCPWEVKAEIPSDEPPILEVRK